MRSQLREAQQWGREAARSRCGLHVQPAELYSKPKRLRHLGNMFSNRSSTGRLPYAVPSTIPDFFESRNRRRYTKLYLTLPPDGDREKPAIPHAHFMLAKIRSEKACFLHSEVCMKRPKCSILNQLVVDLLLCIPD